jgi:hypothetical protein
LVGLAARPVTGRAWLVESCTTCEPLQRGGNNSVPSRNFQAESLTVCSHSWSAQCIIARIERRWCHQASPRNAAKRPIHRSARRSLTWQLARGQPARDDQVCYLSALAFRVSSRCRRLGHWTLMQITTQREIGSGAWCRQPVFKQLFLPRPVVVKTSFTDSLGLTMVLLSDFAVCDESDTSFPPSRTVPEQN